LSFYNTFNKLNPEIRALLERMPSSTSSSILIFEKKVASSSIWTLYSYLNSCGCRVLYGAVGISSSKPAILGMASRLGGFEALPGDPWWRWTWRRDTLDIKPMMQEIDECMVLEEDPEMTGI
jgi:hypothetical protein